jgi:hypothetical protein
MPNNNSKTPVKKIENVKSLTLDKHNVNQGTERGSEMIDWSIEELGFGRAIVADRNGVVLAGNSVTKRALKKAPKVRVVQTKGDELVIVQRTDLDLRGKGEEAKKARTLTIADNRTSQENYLPDTGMLLKHAKGLELTALWTPEELETLGRVAEQQALVNDLNEITNVEIEPTEEGEGRPPGSSRADYRPFTLMFTPAQDHLVRDAINKAKLKFKKTETSADAIYRIAEEWLKSQ